jgi:hypothetical protein
MENWVAQVVLGRPLNKRTRMSNWEQRPLSDAQLQYAALDATCCVRIYDRVVTSTQAVPSEMRPTAFTFRAARQARPAPHAFVSVPPALARPDTDHNDHSGDKDHLAAALLGFPGGAPNAANASHADGDGASEATEGVVAVETAAVAAVETVETATPVSG